MRFLDLCEKWLLLSSEVDTSIRYGFFLRLSDTVDPNRTLERSIAAIVEDQVGASGKHERKRRDNPNARQGSGPVTATHGNAALAIGRSPRDPGREEVCNDAHAYNQRRVLVSVSIKTASEWSMCSEPTIPRPCKGWRRTVFPPRRDISSAFRFWRYQAPCGQIRPIDVGGRHYPGSWSYGFFQGFGSNGTG